MGVYLLPEYLMNTTRTPLATLLPVWAETIDSLSQQSGDTIFPRPTASALLQYKMMDLKNVTSLDAQNLSRMMEDVNIAKTAPWSVWKSYLVSMDKSGIQKLAVDKIMMDLPHGLVRDFFILFLIGK